MEVSNREVWIQMSPWELGSLKDLLGFRAPQTDHFLSQVYTILLVQLLVTLAVVALFTFW